MKFISFGKEKAQVSQIILGMMRTSEMTTKNVADLVKASLDCGINFLDTADCYGLGKAESVLGEVFAQNAELRQKVFLQSKCGIRVDSDFTWYDLSKEHIVNAVNASLSRLKTDHLDSLLLHRPDALMEPAEIAQAFEILHREGKVLNFGVSNMNPFQMEMLRTELPFEIVADQVQLSCAFTPMIQAGVNVNLANDAAVMRDGGILNYCQLHQIAVQSWSSLQFGFFEGTFLGSEKFPQLNAVLNRIAEEKKTTAAAVAIAWILRYPAKMQTVVGTTKIKRLAEIAQATEINLSKKEWYEIYLSVGNTLP